MRWLQTFLAGPRRNYAIAVATVALMIGIAVSLATGLIGNGGSGESFDAQGFVDAANDEGAGIVLGDPLFSAQKGTDVYDISFEPAAGAAEQPSGEGHGGASLTITPDSAAAIQVYSQCEDTGTFICYRANNAALVLDEGASHDDLARVDAAIRAMASD